MIMKKSILLSAVLFNLSVAAADQDYYYDFKNLAIEQVIAKVGDSRIIRIKLPMCTNGDPNSCTDFSQKILFNCSSNKIYSLGYFATDQSGMPDITDDFNYDPELLPAIPAVKRSCKSKPELARAYVLVSSTSDLEGYFLISDTLKNEKGILSAWIETRQFQRTLNPFFADRPSEKIKSWMYSKTPKPDSEYSKFNWRFDCNARTTNIISTVDYKSNGQVKSSDDFPGSKFRPVVPGSVGEGMLETVCEMY